MMYQVKEGPKTSWVNGSAAKNKEPFIAWWRNFFSIKENKIENVEIEKSGYLLLKCENEAEEEFKSLFHGGWL